MLDGELKKNSQYLNYIAKYIEQRIDEIQTALYKVDPSKPYDDHAATVLNGTTEKEIIKEKIVETNSKILYSKVIQDDIIIEALDKNNAGSLNWNWNIPSFKVISNPYTCIEILFNQTTQKPVFICHLNDDIKELVVIESGYSKIMVIS